MGGRGRWDEEGEIKEGRWDWGRRKEKGKVGRMEGEQKKKENEEEKVRLYAKRENT